MMDSYILPALHIQDRQASSLVEIPTPRVRCPYPTWTLLMNCYNITLGDGIAKIEKVLLLI